jgi:streptomycin 6-kinase
LNDRILIPADFAAGIANEGGEPGRAWLQRLPALVAELCARWDLTIEGAPMHGYLGLVVPVRRGDEPAALKVSWINPSTAHEIAALAAWNGRGAVRLLEADPDLRAMLLERLDSQRSLENLPIRKAAPIAAQLLRRLAVPAPAGLPLQHDLTQQIAATLVERWEGLGRPISRRLIDAARDRATQLGPTAGSLMVNWDLHYRNVLAGEREPWLAVDPKIAVGDPEFGLAQLLWTRLEDLERDGGLNRYFPLFVDQAGLDLPLARSWTLVRCVDYWLWALSAGLTEDPARCAAITIWLAESEPGTISN